MFSFRSYLAAILMALIAGPVAAQTIMGTVRVIDADTFDLGAPANVRLLGIDAAEETQDCRAADGTTAPCGQLATQAARALYGGRTARCAVTGRDRYDRYLATCAVGGVDMGADLVSRGIARRYRDDLTYAEEEKAAILFRRGLWAYDMDDPAVWRARQRSGSQAASGACTIKGNVSENGRIYHMPGSRNYDRTRIDTGRGERWFCTEAEARAAGWRAPRS